MPNTKNHSLKSWLLSRPALFALISFVAMTIGSMLASLISGGESMTLTSTITFIAFFVSVAWLVRSLPGDNLSRRSFVAIHNAQTFITSVVFISSMLYIIANAQSLMMRLLQMEANSSAWFMIFLVLAGIFYLYLCGIYIANLYAKYRRVRAMGVSMWKALATAPFGFCMLWIPGYLMDDEPGKHPTSHNWYARLTDWIIARPMRAATTLVILIMLSGFTFGYMAVLLPLSLAIVFAAWSRIVGTDQIRKNFGGIYSTTAIAINVIMIVSLLGYFIIAQSHQRGNFETPEMVQYIDTVQQQ